MEHLERFLVMQIIKYLDLNDNANTVNQNVWDLVKTTIRKQSLKCIY